MNNKTIYLGFIIVVLAFVGALGYLQAIKKSIPVTASPAAGPPILNQADGAVPSSEISGETELPVVWGDMGSEMIKSGVIDANKFEAIYQGRGGLNAQEKELLYGMSNGRLKINSENSGIILNLLWALGLGNKNNILENGEMTDPQYGGAGNFASTGGWTIASGNPMDHYSRHLFVVLTADQQALVDRVSRNIYRPCCGNSTHFPDCNHGMAMLGLLELMASQGVSENDMYKYALKVNEFWFPDNYATIDAYLKTQGRSLETADPKEILGAEYSSITGYQNILKLVTSPVNRNEGSCGV